MQQPGHLVRSPNNEDLPSLNDDPHEMNHEERSPHYSPVSKSARFHIINNFSSYINLGLIVLALIEYNVADLECYTQL